MEKNTFDFEGRTAVITGGAQGFGFDIAKRFLESGSRVIIWDIDKKLLNDALNKINNPKLSSNIVDVSNYELVENSVSEIFRKRIPPLCFIKPGLLLICSNLSVINLK